MKIMIKNILVGNFKNIILTYIKPNDYSVRNKNLKNIIYIFLIK